MLQFGGLELCLGEFIPKHEQNIFFGLKQIENMRRHGFISLGQQELHF